MQVTAIGSNPQYNGLKSSQDSEIAALEKSKSRLQEQIEKAKESQLDTKTKQERIKVLQDEIEQIDSTIQQKKLDKIRQKGDASSVSAGNTAENTNGKADATGTLIQISSSYKQMQVLDSLKSGLKGEGRVLAGEIALDQSRGGSSAAVDKKREKLEALKEKQQDLSEKIGEKGSEMNKDLKDVRSVEIETDKALPEGQNTPANNTNTGRQDLQRPSDELSKQVINPPDRIDLYI